jgi:hypothetical protein
MTLRKLTLLLLTLSLAACSHADNSQRWVRNYEGNQLEMVPGHRGDEADNKRYINVTNTNRTWVGSLAGGEEKLETRKQFLRNLAATEAQRLCAPNGFAERGEPDYVMTEKSEMAYGGGLIGYAIASAMADYANLPIQMVYYYACTSAAAAPAPAVTQPLEPAPSTLTPAAAAQPLAPAPAITTPTVIAPVPVPAPLLGIPRAN